MHRRSVIGSIILLYATATGAQEFPAEVPVTTPSPSVDQFIYKGIVGNLLEAVPLDAKDRVQLQRANAVLGGPLSARSLATVLGIASPPLMVLGVIWGLWSATKIEPAESSAAQSPNPLLVALRASAPSHAADERPAADHNPAHNLERTPWDRAPRYATASELDAIVGSKRASPLLPCDNCYQQMLDAKNISISR